jgi:hypothetical protein
VVVTTWNDVTTAAPDLAGHVQKCFDAHIHKTMATLRRDGSPRISGIEAQFRQGELTIGMMPQSLKARDVLRDSRIALHSASPDPEQTDETGTWPGDAKIAGRALQVTDPEVLESVADNVPAGGAVFFTVDVTEVVWNRLGGDPPDHMLIDFWTPHDGLRQAKRD